MSTRNSIFGNRNKEANEPLPTPTTPNDHKANSKNKKMTIDEFISNPSPGWTHKEHRWSFTSSMSNGNSVYLDSNCVDKDTTPKKPQQKRRGKRPKPLLKNADLESIEAYSSSEESEVSEYEQPIAHEPKVEEPLEEDHQSNGEEVFGWSRVPSKKLEKKKKTWKKKISKSSNHAVDFLSQSMRSIPSSSSSAVDFLSQSMRNVPLTSTEKRKGLKKTRSLETSFSRKPVRRTMSAKKVDLEDPANKKPFTLRRQAPKKSNSIRNMDSSNRDSSIDPAELRNSLSSTEDVMNRSDSELSRIRTKLQKIKSSRTSEGSASRDRKEVRSLDRLTMKKGKSSRKLTREDSSSSGEQPTEGTRTRKQTRSLDRLSKSKRKSSRKIVDEDSSDSKEQPTEETKAKLGASLPDLSLDSSVGQRQRSKKSKPRRTSSVEGNESGLSLDGFPAGPKKSRNPRGRSKSLDEWGEDSITDLAQVLSSSNERFHKPHESDENKEHAGAMQVWSARMRNSAGSTAKSTEKVSESPERRKGLTRTRSSRRDKLAKGNSLPDLSLDPPATRQRKSSKQRSRRSSTSVYSNEGTFGGRVRRKQKQRSRSLDHNTTWFSSSDSDLSLAISEGLESFDALESISSEDQERVPRRAPSRLGSSQSSDHTQTSNGRKRVSKTRSDGSLAKVKRVSPVQRPALNRATSAGDLNSSFGSLRINSAGQIMSTSALRAQDIQNEIKDDLSLSDHSVEDNRNPLEMLEDGLSKSIQRLRAAKGLQPDLGEESEDEDEVPEEIVANESEPLDPDASTKDITEVIDDIAEALEETNRLKRIMEVEAVLHDLQNTFQHFDMEDSQMRSKALKGENVVLRVRLQQQDELLKKYKNQIVAEDSSQTVQKEEEKASETSAEQMKREIEELKSKLEEKEKTIEEQASRCTKMEAEMVELQRDARHGKEVQSLEKRIWQLEKEKTAFMVEISRLHQSNFDSAELTPDPLNSSASSTSVEQNSPGLVGWLMGGPRQ